MKRFFYLLILIAAVGGLLALKIRADLHAPISLNGPMFLSVKKGDTLSSISKDLAEKAVVSSERALRIANRLYGPKPVLAADYQLQPGMTILELYQALTEGKAIASDKEVTLVEGLTIPQIADELVEAGVIEDRQAFIDIANKQANTFVADYPFLKDKPAKASLEGYLFPDTYRFFPKTEPEAVIRKLLDNLQQRWNGVNPMVMGGRSVYDVMTLASIVEREVQKPGDMKTVAGLFANRLEIGMALQSDATIGYVTQSGRARSTHDELEIDSPYNTYKYAGLPPGPISNPGWNAIDAVLSPDRNDYLFFLTDKDGKVYYAKDLAGHNANRRYLEGVK